METYDLDYQEREPRLPATVSKEKWRTHLLTKLSRGYVLIVSEERRNANFFMAGKGYESCAYDAARQVVNAGLVVKAYDHYLGDAYMLAAPVPEAALPTPPPAADPLETLLDALADEMDEAEA